MYRKSFGLILGVVSEKFMSSRNSLVCVEARCLRVVHFMTINISMPNSAVFDYKMRILDRRIEAGVHKTCEGSQVTK